jgi:large subunit ribosomal protein L4
MAFPPGMRSYGGKVNRKVARAALRAALAAHAKEGSLGILDGAAFTEPSTSQAAAFMKGWGKPTPLILVVTNDEDVLSKSFRNLDGVAVTVPSELEVQHLVRARSLLMSEPALVEVQGRAG